MSEDDNKLPMFYKSPRPLDRVRDANKGVSRPSNFRFAAGTNAIPLLIDELPRAAAYYPIVFAQSNAAVPAAVVGLRTDENLFIGGDGRWLNGAYLPSYVRRYPFILMDDRSGEQSVLCIDDASDMISADGEQPLFENGQPSDFTKSAMHFCQTLREGADPTDEFARELQKWEMLIANDAELDLRNGTQLRLTGFLTVDPSKFDGLPDEVIVEWRHKGWLGAIYAQLLSSHRWQNLVDLNSVRDQANLESMMPNVPQAASKDLVRTTSSRIAEEFRLHTRPVRGSLSKHYSF